MKNITFTHIHKENIRQFGRLYKLYAPYKIKTLKHHGEYPLGKKTFKKLLRGMIENAALESGDVQNDHIVVMHAGSKIIGFAVFNLRAKEVVALPYPYGTISDFCIVPKYRRKGFGNRLYAYVESILIENGVQVVFLYPDPVTGTPFWEAMGYVDTGLNKGVGRYFVYKRHLIVTENTPKIDRALSDLASDTDFCAVNPYNKHEIKELFPLWLAYWRETIESHESRRKIKRGLINRVCFARETPKNHFNALYYKGKIIGFSWFGVYSGNKDINDNKEYGYVLEYAVAPAFRRKGFATLMNEETQKILLRDGVSCAYLTPNANTGLPFWKAMGYTDSGIKTHGEQKALYVKAFYR